MTLAFAYLLTVLGIAGAEATYVQADLVRMRFEPGSDALVRGTLRLNTSLWAERVEGEWTQVLHPPTNTKGWILTRFLGPKPVELSALQALAPDAKPEERVSTLERWLALEPNRPELYSQLAQAYRDAGKAERAAHLERRLKGQLPTMLGICLGERRGDEAGRHIVTLFGSYSKGTLRLKTLDAPPGEDGAPPLDPLDSPDTQPLYTLAREMQNLFWARAEEARVPPGTPFPAMTVGLFSSGPASPQFYAVELGEQRCEPGELWASAPFAPATLTPKQQAALKKFEAAHPMRSKDGRNVKLYPVKSGPWIQPLFSDGSVISARYLSGGLDPMNYYGLDLVLISPKNKVQRLEAWVNAQPQ